MSFDPLNDQTLADDTATVPVAPATPAPPVMTASRIKRNLLEGAIDAARRAAWVEAAEINEKMLEMGPDVAAQNRLAKSLWEQGELAKAREHYQSALAIDPTNRIAERNIGRLRFLMAEAGSKTVAAAEGSKAAVGIFVEETGKTGFAHLVELVSAADLAQVNPGDLVELAPSGTRLVAKANGKRIGVVEPRVAARLIKLVADGNRYAAGVTSLGDKDVRIIIRETFQDPANFGKVSFPTAARVSDLRPYTKGTLVREELDLDEEFELDDDVDSIEPASARAAAGGAETADGFQVVTEDSPVDGDGDGAKAKKKGTDEDS
jgi:tetratricopeptide (TPR) repeat protein